jgi:hypothetical protein
MMSTLLSVVFAAIYLEKLVVLGLTTVRRGHDWLSATRATPRAARADRV